MPRNVAIVVDMPVSVILNEITFESRPLNSGRMLGAELCPLKVLILKL